MFFLESQSFFHTVLQNSEFCPTVIDHNLRLTNWRRKQGCKCQYKHIVDWCGCSPNDFRSADWSRLVATQSKPLFFARKFEPIVNQNVINKLQQMFDPNFDRKIRAVESYWHNEYHCEDPRDATNDAKLTFYYAFAVNSLIGFENKCRLSRNQSVNPKELLLNTTRILEANLYFNSDSFEGIVVTFESRRDHLSVITLETLVRPSNPSNHSSNSLPKKLISIEV